MLRRDRPGARAPITQTTAATVATVLHAVGAVLLFGVRSWQQKRTTGATGFNGFFAGRAPAARVAGLSFAVAKLAGLVLPALVMLGVLPVLSLGPAAAWVGLGLAVAGFGLAVLAQQTMVGPGASASTRVSGPSWSPAGSSGTSGTQSSPP